MNTCFGGSKARKDETLALHGALFAPPDSARERERGVSAAKTVKETLPV